MSHTLTPTLRGRYAPSPTGALHMGNLRTALLAWLFARCASGQFILRIEDLDQPRMKPHATEQMIQDLQWLGLDWDEGPEGGPYAPYIQSERVEIYQNYLQQLQSAGLVYPCYCSRAEIQQAAAHFPPGIDGGARYPGTCRQLTDRQRRQHERQGRHPSLRLRVPDEQNIAFTDLLLGSQQQQVQQAVGDFILRRADGIIAYQFAVVVDDALMQINQIVRGPTCSPQLRARSSSLSYSTSLFLALPMPHSFATSRGRSSLNAFKARDWALYARLTIQRKRLLVAWLIVVGCLLNRHQLAPRNWPRTIASNPLQFYVSACGATPAHNG
ncbi:glutamate--tRNA ligase family protein [Dictyobacter kobayashii]|uniref:Glutamyl/glutaminyl-tRNA synthetase class Ib catalytic domain-containing protein n=1 Tax=Dictyobacter kobayashii TaxID=2014872 RepID=A0A402AMQ7_9CHLR|nr:glutamate--tRNA ligase family protein [Dictyobacter kobayashii]GCE20305.1 hypothetical protein KDK_41050 [Dictyobacter kobayashii]